MKVYEGFNGTQIKFSPKVRAKGTEFMVQECEDCIKLIKLEVDKNGKVEA